MVFGEVARVAKVPMSKDPDSIFDIDAIAARNLAEAELRVAAFDMALRLAQWYDEDSQRPVDEVAKLANKLHAYFHTGELPNGRK